MTQNLKVVMYKNITTPKMDVEYNLSRMIDNFVYETGGCITGWSRHIDTPLITEHQISYTCFIEDRSDHRSDLSNYLDKIKEEHPGVIVESLNNFETVKVYFED